MNELTPEQEDYLLEEAREKDKEKRKWYVHYVNKN